MSDVVEKEKTKHLGPANIVNDDNGYLDVIDTEGTDKPLVELVLNGTSILLNAKEADRLRDWLADWVAMHAA